jgi:TP901 family phage tail tape measure protein
MAGGAIDVLVEPDFQGFPSKFSSGLRGATSGAAGLVSSVGRGLGLAIAAGTAVAGAGLSSVIKLGNEYQGNLNELQAVTQATGLQMEKVGQTAKNLGADMTLPATSAADAANAMVELAKGGLSVDEAMQAAKGTLQLAAAAQVDGATAAELQSAALNSFGLAADQAGRVADVLANTANASASSMIDVGNSLKYVAPVSAALKVSIEDTAAAIGLLANQGIKGEQAGTSLRGILASLASPSKEAAAAMQELGIQAFDTQGKFVGLRAFTDQLAQAKGRLTDAEFAAAASTAFGNEGFTAANALAAEGASAFDAMATSVSRAGGAADVAAAQTKGLGGAWEGFQSQLETAGIAVYEVVAPGLEAGVRAASDFVSRFTPTVIGGIETAVAAGQLFGPGLAAAIQDRAGAAVAVVQDVIEPIGDAIVASLNSALNLGLTVFGGFAEVVSEAAHAVEPLATGIGDVVESVNGATGPVGALASGLELVYDATSGLISILSPVVALVGGAVSVFSALPGPIQTAALAMLALKVGPSILGGLRSALRGTAQDAGEAGRQTGLFGRTVGLALAPVRLAAAGMSSAAGVIRQYNSEASAQRVYAAQAGESVGRLGGYMAAFRTSTIPAVAAARGFSEQTAAIRAGAAAAGQPIGVMTAAMGTLVERSPALSAMRGAFDNASAGAVRFGRTAGVAAAAGKGLQLAASGLMSAMGGPLGIAIAGLGVGLSLLAGSQQEAKAKAEQHRNAVNSLARAMREAASAGKDVGDALRNELQTSLIEDFSRGADAAENLGISLNTVLDAAQQGGDALEVLRDQLLAISREGGGGEGAFFLSKNTEEALRLLGVVNQLRDRTEDAEEANRRFSDTTEGSFLAASGSGMQLAGAMDVLADKTASADDRARALKSALDALNGGQLSLEQAQSRVNQLIGDLASRFGDAEARAQGWGAALLNADGSINTVSENGQFLLNTMDDLGGSMADVAQKTFDTARAQGDDMPTAMDKARKASQGVRDSFIAQAETLGLTTEQAVALADRYNLIPDEVLTLINAPGMDSTQVELILLKQLVDAVPPNKPIVVQSISEEAKKKLIDIGFTVRTLPNGQVEVVARTQAAKDALAEVTRPRTVTITAIYRGASNTAYGTMNPLGSYSALGNVIAPAYASGGIHKLTPMQAGIAQVVPPNSWRIVGDRMRGDEFYIPDDEAPRSISLGLEWARRRGFVLARTFATGGVASTAAGRTESAVVGPPVIQNNHFPPSLEPERIADIVMDRLSWRR